MAKLSLDLSQFKAAGVYTVEIDNSQRIVVSTQSLRLVVGFSEVGPQNTVVFITSKEDLRNFYGTSNSKLERKGSFFHRMIETCLQSSPVFAISLLPVNTSTGSDNKDVVDVCLMSLATNEANPAIGKDGINIGTRPYYSLFNRSRFWTPDAEYLQSQANILAGTNNDVDAPLLQITNVGTKTISLLAFKPTNLSGYNVFAKDWYGSESNIPYAWINPYDKISDYFLQFYAIEGEWNNYTSLSIDPYWSNYFTSSGIKRDKLIQFLSLPEVNLIGSWTGTIIPDFRDKMGSLQYIESIINSNVSLTGLMINVNKEALDALDDYQEITYKLDLIGTGLTSSGEKNVSIKMLSYDIDVPKDEFFTKISYIKNCGILGQSTPNWTTFLCPPTEGSNISIGDLIESNTEGSLAYITNKLWVSVGKNTQYIDETGNLIDISTIQGEVSRNNENNGAWVLTASIPVKAHVLNSTPEEDVKAGGKVSPVNFINKQKNISDESICTEYKVSVIKGLKITTKHLPGYDKNGAMNAEAGVEKIYEMLQDTGINRGLINPDMISYRYIIDTMAYGLQPNMGGKAYVSKLAKQRGKTTAILNAPSIGQFAKAQDPYFCDTFVSGQSKPIFNTKWIPEGGNPNMQRSFKFSLPGEDYGAKYCGVFGPFLKYTDNGKSILVPPAADVANAYIRKFMGGDPYAIVANKNGILTNTAIAGVEYAFDTEDREYLEPFGYNVIIERPKTGEVMIYANATSYQTIKSDYNSLHVRELLNTIELECNDALNNYVFEKNTAVMRMNVINTLTPILETMKDAGALYDYDLVMDSSNNTNEVIDDGVAIVDIGVWITKGMQKIIQRISVNNLSGSSY